MNDFPEIELDQAQATAIGRAMLAVARADGQLDTREMALIEELSSSVSSDDPDPVPVELAGILKTAPERETLLRSAILVGLVDGDYSDAEKAIVESYAKAFGVPPARLDEMASAVKAFLVGPLLQLANTDVVVEVSKKLQV